MSRLHATLLQSVELNLHGVGPDEWTIFGADLGHLPIAITDDFGTLVIVDDQRGQRQHYWADAVDIDESAVDFANDYLIRAHKQREAERRAEHESARARALLTPPPITAELTEEDEFGEVTLRIGHDERFLDTRIVRLDVAGAEAPVLLTHAQLRALVLAANTLLGPAARRQAVAS